MASYSVPKERLPPDYLVPAERLEALARENDRLIAANTAMIELRTVDHAKIEEFTRENVRLTAKVLELGVQLFKLEPPPEPLCKLCGMNSGYHSPDCLGATG